MYHSSYLLRLRGHRIGRLHKGCSLKTSKRTCKASTIVSQSDPESKRKSKKLILMRHAESEDDAKSGRDHDRPITPLGKKAAAKIASTLELLGWVPDIAIGSNSLRTRQTFEAMCAVLPHLERADAHFFGSLYTAAALDGETRSKLESAIVSETDDEHSCVLCLGHNKGWEEAASSFAGTAIKLGHCYAALLESHGDDWQSVFDDDSEWVLAHLLMP